MPVGRDTRCSAKCAGKQLHGGPLSVSSSLLSASRLVFLPAPRLIEVLVPLISPPKLLDATGHSVTAHQRLPRALAPQRGAFSCCTSGEADSRDWQEGDLWEVSAGNFPGAGQRYAELRRAPRLGGLRRRHLRELPDGLRCGACHAWSRAQSRDTEEKYPVLLATSKLPAPS